MPLRATLQHTFSTGDAVEIYVLLEYPGLLPQTRVLKYRRGEDLLAVNIGPFVLAEAERLEALLARAEEFEQVVGQDVVLLLSDDEEPQPSPIMEVVLERVQKTFDVVTLEVRVLHRPTGQSVVKSLLFATVETMSRASLQALLTAEGSRLAALHEMIPYVDALRGIDLVAWARESSLVSGD